MILIILVWNLKIFNAIVLILIYRCSNPILHKAFWVREAAKLLPFGDSPSLSSLLLLSYQLLLEGALWAKVDPKSESFRLPKQTQLIKITSVFKKNCNSVMALYFYASLIVTHSKVPLIGLLLSLQEYHY